MSSCISQSITQDFTIELPRLLSDVLACAKVVETRISIHVSKSYPPVQVPSARSDLAEIAQLDTLIAQIGGVFKEISASFQGAISALGRRRNASIDINTLPDEILCPIFVEGAGSDILAIADTCTRWREVCINRHELWKDISLPRTYDRARRLLSMAQMGGHPIGVGISGRTGEEVRRLFLPATGLIRRLTVSSWWGEDWFDGSFPQLQELSVGVNDSSPELFILPPHLGMEGKLTSVSFRRCRMPYLPECYRGLTTLRIAYRWYESDRETPGMSSATDGSLTEVLRACPDLEELALSWTPISLKREAVFQPPIPGVHTPMIPLLRLRRLRLDMFVHQLSALLTHMTTSYALTSVDFTVLPLELHRTDVEAHIFDASVQQSLLSLPLEQCLPILSTLDTIAIRNVNIKDDYTPTLSPPTPFSINFDGPLEDRSPQSLAASFDNFFTSNWLVQPHYALDNVRTLYLDLMEDMPRFSDRGLMQISRVLRNVRTLALAVDNPFLAVDLLIRLARKRGEGLPEGEQLLPHLEVVALVGCSLRHEKVVEPIVNAVKRLGVNALRFDCCLVGRGTSKEAISRYVSEGGLTWVD